MTCSLGISNFLEEISSLSHSVVFLYLHWSLRKAFLSLLAILWNSAFRWVYLSFFPLPSVSFLFSPICKASSDNHFAFLHFFFLRIVLIPASCTRSRTSVHSSSDTLSIRSNPLNLFVTKRLSQGSLECWSPLYRKESDMTATELNWAGNAAAGLWSILGIAGLWSVPLLREGEPSWFSLNSKRNLGH